MSTSAFHPLELLSPAKDLSCGLAAINHGADAVYIGAPQFSARKSAANTIADIEKLVRYAHLYRSKVYVALNTLLYDSEMEDAVKLVHQIYSAGTDALIVQDFGLLETALPPIALHASTQMDNRTAAKVGFLEKAGFDQVVLARELSVDEIRHIRSHTSVKLEYFIHGALCVCYSGQCYMSQAINKRSANRGECGQPCRLPYSLTAVKGERLETGKHLLSMKDNNLTDYLGQLADAGISSFKIEGRLKDRDYVANITAWYRKKLDDILTHQPHLQRMGTGLSDLLFEPSPEKSFNRGFSTYFANGRPQEPIWAVDSPKAIGEKIGKVSKVEKNRFLIAGPHDIANGDGLCYFNRNHQLNGLRVNKVEDNYIYPLQMADLYAGATLFRNFNHQFNALFKKETAVRTIGLDMKLEADDLPNFHLQLVDEDGLTSRYQATLSVQPATNHQAAANQIIRQLSKTGQTVFKIRHIQTDGADGWFIPAGEINALRRAALEQHENLRIKVFSATSINLPDTAHPYPEATIDKNGNVLNQYARRFFERHGASVVHWGFELQAKLDNETVMVTKHCILHERGNCLKHDPLMRKQLPLYLENEKDLYELVFDCKQCEMQVIRRTQRSAATPS